MSSNSLFLRFWMSENCRNVFLSNTESADLSSLRLVCHDFSVRAAPYLFDNLAITFKASSFTRPARMAALERIGHHVETLSFNLPHTEETFLPPLIDPLTGEERKFVYTPQTRPLSTLLERIKQPKYGSWEMTDLLIKQYPPLFHAATNVVAFVRAFSALSNLSHLKISCPGQENVQRSRRSTVDYALISVRIAVERACLTHLDTLSLLPIHPTGVFYLQPLLGFGATPSSSRRWSQIRKLAIHMDSYPISRNTRTDHLQILHNYLRTLSPSLTRLFFRWKGDKGPSPFASDGEPFFETSHRDRTHPATRRRRPRPPKFPKLKHMELENAVMDAHQISTFIHTHRHTLTEVDFEDVQLSSGTWDDALASLTELTGSAEWKEKQEEVMDVPLILSPLNLAPGILARTAQEQKAEGERGGVTMSRWLSKGRKGRAVEKAKEQLWECEEHMKRFLRCSVFPWR
ncbi:hypothetical protein B0A49_10809 [Cryomyces minteri]|uniref:Uncharacterized protein n=1 Tax=Cryomyces minteri TaxID=331657 RepID=A0A4U0WPA3_9PEZI|nr:hypothetical protein B0A49_10809 [Cryomyces minteri]